VGFGDLALKAGVNPNRRSRPWTRCAGLVGFVGSAGVPIVLGGTHQRHLGQEGPATVLIR
jgi:hypothetical protein